MPLKVVFDGSTSVGDIVLYEWDLNSDGIFEEVGEDKVSYEYGKQGQYSAILKVTD